MSDELTALEESITEVLLDLMTERVMSERRMSTRSPSIIDERSASLPVDCSSRNISSRRRKKN
jgi:hypothetical protein